MPNESDKRHIGYAIFNSGLRVLMTEQEVFVRGKGWTRASKLTYGDKISISTPDEEVVGFSDVEDVMTD